MAVKSINSKYIKNVHPSETPLGLFKDAKTNTFKAFDEKGNIETLSTKNVIYTLGAYLQNNLSNGTSENFTINLPNDANIGSFNLDRAGLTISGGGIANLYVNSNLIKSNSIIFISVESIDPNDAPLVYVFSKEDGQAIIKARVIWNTNPDATQDSFTINFMIINPS